MTDVTVMPRGRRRPTGRGANTAWSCQGARIQRGSFDAGPTPQFRFQAAFIRHVVGNAGREAMIAPVGPDGGLSAGGVAEDVAHVYEQFVARLEREAESR